MANNRVEFLREFISTLVQSDLAICRDPPAAGSELQLITQDEVEDVVDKFVEAYGDVHCGNCAHASICETYRETFRFHGAALFARALGFDAAVEVLDLLAELIAERCDHYEVHKDAG